MFNSFSIDFNKCAIDNNLWPHFVNEMGLEKAIAAIRQALDLQAMQGNPNTIPILIIETCGSALVNTQVVRFYTGLIPCENGHVLLYSSKSISLQLITGN